MTGALEEAAKATGGLIDAMRGSPLAIANLILNICFLVFLFYYVSRISTRAENTVAALFAANDKLYAQWGVIVKDQNALTEKAMHCLLPEDALKLLQLPPRSPIQEPQRPQAPAPPRGDLFIDPPKPHPGSATEHDPTGLIIPIEPHRTSAPVEAEPKPAE
jgi:hypothetical protein